MSGYVVTHVPSRYDEPTGEVVHEQPRFVDIAETPEEARDVVSKDQARRIEEMNMTDQEAEEFDYADWIMVDKSEYAIVPYKTVAR